MYKRNMINPYRHTLSDSEAKVLAFRKGYLPIGFRKLKYTNVCNPRPRGFGRG